MTLSEVEPSGTPPDVQWSDIVWSGDGVSVNPDGTASIVIGDGTSPTFTVTNTVLQLTGTFGVSKKVDGDLDINSPELADVSYTVTASWPAAPGLDAGSLTGVLNADNGFSAGRRDLPPDRNGGDAVRGQAFRRARGCRMGRRHVVGHRIDRSTTMGRRRSSSAMTRHRSSRSPTRRRSSPAPSGSPRSSAGDFDASSPEMAGVTFTVDAAWLPAPGLKAGSVTMKLTAANKFSAPSGVQLPLGTTVTITELEPSGTPPDVRWDDVTWSGDGLTTNPNGTVSFDIGNGTSPQFSVTNHATKLTGTFILAKKVGGDYNLFSPAVIGTTYTVTASWPAGPGDKAGSVTVTLDQENAFRAESGVELPTGTVVTLSEGTESGAGPSVNWVDQGWAADEGLTVNPDGTASFVVGDATDETTAEFAAVDVADKLTGSISLTKQVTGPGAASLPAGYDLHGGLHLRGPRPQGSRNRDPGQRPDRIGVRRAGRDHGDADRGHAVRYLDHVGDPGFRPAGRQHIRGLGHGDRRCGQRRGDSPAESDQRTAATAAEHRGRRRRTWYHRAGPDPGRCGAAVGGVVPPTWLADRPQAVGRANSSDPDREVRRDGGRRNCPQLAAGVRGAACGPVRLGRPARAPWRWVLSATRMRNNAYAERGGR